MLRNFWVAVVAIFFVTGCVSVPQKQAFNREEAGSIHKVSIVYMPEEEYFAVNFGGSPGILAAGGILTGVIGGLISIADMAAKGDRLTSALDPKVLRLQENIAIQLKAGLEKQNYEVDLFPILSWENEEKVIKDLHEKIESDADIFVYTKAGFTAVNTKGGLAMAIDFPYIPDLSVTVIMVDRKSSNILYQENFHYTVEYPHPDVGGQSSASSNLVHFFVPTDSHYQFQTIEELEDNSEKAREALLNGISPIVKHILQDLSKNSI